MTKGRLEAFSDGVIAIIITIMVLELKVPHGETWKDLLPLWPVFLAYVLSFVHIGIYWNNHHHMIHAVKHVTGGALWANLHLLFWLSLVPVTTEWMGETHFSTFPVAVYGVVMLMAAIAYYILRIASLPSTGGTPSLQRRLAETQREFSPLLPMWSQSLRPLSLRSFRWQSTSRSRPSGSFRTGDSSGRRHPREPLDLTVGKIH